MDARAAFEIATKNLPPAAERFYGIATEAGMGTGMMLSNVAYPAYLAEHGRFGIVEGIVIVLTHECDLDLANERVLNNAAVICPVIPLEQFVAALGEMLDDDAAEKLLSNITSRNVNRLLYLPIVPDVLPMGGYLYLNLLTSTHRSKLEGEEVARLCMMSGDGLRELDHAIERHFRRPKADRLPFQPRAAD